MSTHFTQYKHWHPYISPFDPCPPMKVKTYSTPPQLYIQFQPKGLAQYNTAREALQRGTLWPDLYSPYPEPQPRGDHDG